MIKTTTLLLAALFAAFPLPAQTVFFRENFDDPNFTQRGWYDNVSIPTTAAEFRGAGGRAAEYTFLPGKTTPNGGAVRRLFTPTTSLYISYWVKYSAGYVGSDKPYHPHEFNVVTTLNDKYIGPASTKMTLYVEHNNGYPVLAFQDSQNIDTANIKKDLTSVTELRACAGCNGSGDAYPAGDCYKSGVSWRNGKLWKSAVRTFGSEGNYDKNEWHFIEAFFRLNTIAGGKGIPDGAAQYWFDGEAIIDARNVLFRTAANPGMMFNQLLIAPYIGDGSPVEQTMWIDDLSVADGRISTGTEESAAAPPHILLSDDAVRITSVQAEDIRALRLTDIFGGEMPDIRAEYPQSGVIIPTGALPAGVYGLTVTTARETLRKVLLIAR